MPLNSMTGYGKGESVCDGLTVTVELKTVNHRYADISVKMPRSLMALENSLRKRLAQALKRGKIDAYVNYELTGDSLATPQLNHELAAAYQKILNEMRQELGLAGETTAEYIANQKDVIQVREAELDEKALQDVYQAYEFSASAHDGQLRRSGEPYVYHPLAVARILAGMRLDSRSNLPVRFEGVGETFIGRRVGGAVLDPALGHGDGFLRSAFLDQMADHEA